MVAEAPVVLAVSFLEPATKEHIVATLFGSPTSLLGVALGTALLGLFVGWLGHRLGFGL